MAKYWKLGILTVSLALVLLASACTDDDPSDQLEGRRTSTTTTVRATAGSYVGKVDGSDAYVGLVVRSDGDALAYVTDGNHSVDWLTGSVAPARAALANDGGASLAVTFAHAGASGTFTRPDSPALRFTARPVDRPAGTYLARASFADGDYVAGWIVLADGSQRGAVRRYETPLPAGDPPPTLDLARPEITVPGGKLTATWIDPGTLLPVL